MYHIYHTEGVILGSRNFGESGKYFHIFTRELGMVAASASGVRKMSSRLRFILQDFAYVKADLVRGKDFWRITTASKTDRLDDFGRNFGAAKIFTSVARLLRRLLSGEDPNEELFMNLVEGMEKLHQAGSEEERKRVEIYLVLKILQNLGYVGEQQVEDLLSASKRGEVLYFINKILNETHL